MADEEPTPRWTRDSPAVKRAVARLQAELRNPAMARALDDDLPLAWLVDEEGRSLYGSCSHCRRRVDNHDENHRVSAIMRGGRGVECVLRGDIVGIQAQPLGSGPCVWKP